MLSVQSAGCAGMERLGVPARTSINSPSDDRGHISRRIRVDAIQARDIIVRDATMINDRQIRNNHHHHYHHHRSGGCAGSGVRGIDNCSGVIGASAIPVQSNEKHKSTITPQQQQQLQTTKTQNVIRCPHHVPLPDSEWGQDRDLQIRARYQNSEIVRTYITPPPNKTVLDVPEQSFNLFTSSGISCNLGANYNNLQQYYQQHNNNNNNNHHNHTNNYQQQQQQQQQQAQQQQKSKPNVIQKLFSRKSSPKSPQPSPTLLSSSSCSSVASSASSSSTSTSSSSSLNCTSIALPISIASALTTTSCNLGTSLLVGPSTTTHQSISSSSQQPIGTVSIPLLSLGTTTTSVPTTITHNIDNNDDIDLTTNSQTLATIDILNGTSTTGTITTTNLNSNNHQYKYDQLIRIDNNTTSTNPSIASSICLSTLSSTTTASASSSTTLQLYKSKSCNLSQISLASASSSSSMGSLSPHSTDCCYTQATNVRPRPRTPNDYYSGGSGGGGNGNGSSGLNSGKQQHDHV